LETPKKKKKKPHTFTIHNLRPMDETEAEEYLNKVFGKKTANYFPKMTIYH